MVRASEVAELEARVEALEGELLKAKGELIESKRELLAVMRECELRGARMLAMLAQTSERVVQ
jgi:hypothetical protein